MKQFPIFASIALAALISAGCASWKSADDEGPEIALTPIKSKFQVIAGNTLPNRQIRVAVIDYHGANRQLKSNARAYVRIGVLFPASDVFRPEVEPVVCDTAKDVANTIAPYAEYVPVGFVLAENGVPLRDAPSAAFQAFFAQLSKEMKEQDIQFVRIDMPNVKILR